MIKDLEKQIVIEARKRRIAPERMTAWQRKQIVMAIYAREGQLLEAAQSALDSLIRTKAFNYRVLPHVIQENKATCVSCPHNKFKVVGDGVPACDACGCDGRLLRSKWEDPTQFCSLTISGKRCDQFGSASPDSKVDPPVWDNRDKPTRKLQVRNSDGTHAV